MLESRLLLEKRVLPVLCELSNSQPSQYGAEQVRFESNLKGGKQSSDQPRENLEYGVSITDGMFDLEFFYEVGFR